MRRRRSLPAALAAAALLALAAGCTTGPDYRRPAVDLPAAWRTAPGDAADLANTEWWKAFGDPHLERLVQQAIDANRDLRVAAYRIDEYAARLKVSQAASLPIVGAGVNASRAQLSQERPNGLRLGASPVLSNFELGGTFNWEIDLWGRLKRADEAALAELLGTQEARRGLMLTVVSDVAAGYVKLLELDRQLALAERKLALRREGLALTDAKRAGGSATRIEVERLRAAVAEQAAAIPQIRREIASAELALSALLGRAPGPIERRRLEDLALPAMPAAVPADLLTRRPDVAAAEQALVAANARIGVAKASYFPTLSLSAALGLASDDLRWLFAETARTANFGGALAGTLFDGGRTAGTVRQAEAQRDQAAELFLKAVQTALLEVEEALAARTAGQERAQREDERVKALDSVLALTVARQRGGQSDRIDVFDAELKLVEGLQAQAEGQRDTLLAMVSIYKAMGGGWMLEQERRRATAQVAEGNQAGQEASK